MVNNRRIKIVSVILLLVVVITTITACGKKFWQYNTGWFSEDPYIYIAPNHTDNMITVDGKKKQLNAAWDPSGLEIYFYDPKKPEKEGEHEDNYIIIGEVKIRGGKLYMKVTKDTVSDLKGKTIVFEQKRPADLNQLLKV